MGTIRDRDAALDSWYATTALPWPAQPPLAGRERVDVAILGAGYSGLWTAYYLLQRDPSLRVAVVEAEIAGFGASGRNGGWCYAGFPVSLGALAERFGREQARATILAMRETVAEIARVCAEEGIDAQIAAKYSGFSQTINATTGLTVAGILNARRYLNSAKAPMQNRVAVLHEDAEYEMLNLESWLHLFWGAIHICQ